MGIPKNEIVMARVVLAIISTLLAVALWSTMGCASSTQTSYAPGTINNDVMGWVFVKAAVYDSLLLSHHYEPTTGWRATIMWYHRRNPGGGAPKYFYRLAED